MSLVTICNAMRAAAALALTAPTIASAAPVDYRLDPSHTRVHASVRHFGTSTVWSRFDDVSGRLQFDREKNVAQVSIVIGIASLNTGVPPLDTILKRDWFRVSEFPQAYFVSAAVPVQVDAPFTLSGELTLHGASRPLVLRSQGIHCYPHPMLQREVCGADFEADLKRSEFGIVDLIPFVADTVKLQVQVEGLRD